MVRYNYLVPIVAKPCFTFSYLGVSFIDFLKEKTPQSIEITAFLVRLPGLEPGASGLGVITFGSYRVVRRASKCPQTRMNTGFFIELPVAGYSAVLPDIGKFGAKIGAAIRRVLDRIVVDDRRFKGSLEQFNSEI